MRGLNGAVNGPLKQFADTVKLPSDEELTEREAEKWIAECWREGRLRFLLYRHQYDLYDHYYNTKFRKLVWLCSRRFGKSADLILLGWETCIREDGAQVRYGAGTQRMVEEIILPLANMLARYAPECYRPKWVDSKSHYIFPHRPNSVMVVSGLDDGRSKRLRGTFMHLGLIDESQDVDDLSYVVRDVLMPQTITTRGRIIMAGTVPKTLAHPFAEYMFEAEKDGALLKRTIFDDSRPEIIEQIPEFMKEAGGPLSTTWLREYMMELVTDSESALVPEFSRPEVRARVIQESELPPHFIPYTVIDLGYIDHTAVLFGYIDFRRAKKVVLDELVTNRQNSAEIAGAILAKEKQVWGVNEHGDCLVEPRRYADAQPMTIADFNELHGMRVTNVAKDTLEAEVNQLRIDVQSGTLEIHPRCGEVIRQLTYGIWDKQHKDFARSTASGFGHFDMVAACMYYVRHANLRENPYPADYGFSYDLLWKEKKEDDDTSDLLKQAFNLK